MLDSYSNPAGQVGVGNQPSYRGNSGGSGDHRDTALGQGGSNPGHFFEQQRDTQIYKGGAQIANSKILSVQKSAGPAIQPVHHKANSM